MYHRRRTMVVVIGLVLMLGMTISPAFAASTNWIDRIPAVRVDQELTGSFAPRLAIEEYVAGEFTDQPQTIRLIISGAEWLGDEHEYNTEKIAADTEMTGDAVGIETLKLSDTMLEVTLTATGAASEKALWRIPLYTQVVESGDITIRIDAMDSRVSGSIAPYADGVGDGTVVDTDEPDVTDEPEEPADTEPPVEEPAITEVTFTVGQSGYWVDGRWVAADVAPYIQPTTDGLGRIMVPVRFVSEATGADDVIWNPDNRTVLVLKGESTVLMTIGNNVLLVNGDARSMDAVAEIQDIGGGLGRTMVPLAHLAQALDVEYEWDPVTRSVVFFVEQ